MCGWVRKPGIHGRRGCMRASGGGAQYSTEVTGRNVYVVGEELLGSDISFHQEQWKP